MYCGKCDAYIPDFPGIKACLVCSASVEEALQSPRSAAKNQQPAKVLNPAVATAVRPPLKRLVWLLHFSNLTQLLAFVPSNPFYPDRYYFIPSMLLAFALILQFEKGKNWARKLLMIGCALNALSIPVYFWFAKPTLAMDLAGLFEMALSLYLLNFLRKKDVKAYFEAAGGGKTVPPKSKWRPLWIGLGSLAVVIALAGGGLAWIAVHFTAKARQMDVWMQDVVSFESEKLTDSGANMSPSFSHDGTKIAFSHSDDLAAKNPTASINVITLDDKLHATVVNDGGLAVSPAWGAGDSSLFYISKKGEDSEIYRYDFADGAIEQLTDDGGLKRDLSASPDGKWLLFLHEPRDGDAKLYLMPSAGGDRSLLSKMENFLYEPQHPVWRADSKHVLFLAFTSIFTVDLGGNVTSEQDLTEFQIGNISGIASYPSSDGSLILNARPLRNAMPFDFNLYLMPGKTETAELKLLRKSSVAEIGHEFSPDGGRIVFSKPRT